VRYIRPHIKAENGVFTHSYYIMHNAVTHMLLSRVCDRQPISVKHWHTHPHVTGRYQLQKRL